MKNVINIIKSIEWESVFGILCATGIICLIAIDYIGKGMGAIIGWLMLIGFGIMGIIATISIIAMGISDYNSKRNN